MELTNYENTNFPEVLLHESDERKKQYFAGLVAHHPNLDKATEETLRHIRSFVDERIVLVCGPSGVGKNELIKMVTQKITEAEENNPNKRLGCIPVLEAEAIAPKDGSFNFNNLWGAVLEGNEPMMDYKIGWENREDYNKNGERVLLSKKRKGEYEQVLINFLKYRQVQAFIINEAHHTLMVATDKKANSSVNVLKSLASSKRPIVLVGTYELLKYLELNSECVDQIIRRTRIVDFPRYYKNAQGYKHFGAAAQELILNMPFEKIDPNIIYENFDYLFENSLGRIGALKIWLMDAYAIALDRHAQSLTMEDLEASRTPGFLSSTVLEGIEAGEERMKKILSDEKNYNSLKAPAENMDKVISKPSSKKRVPGERNPKRDAALGGLSL